jgi:hypothetical protein
MAATDASAVDAVPDYIRILVATLPVILSPIVAWFLGRSRVSKEAATIDYLNKRLDVLERLNKLHTQLTEGPIRPLLETEIELSRTFLHQPPTFIPHGAEVAVAAPQSRWARFFLTQPAVSVRKRIFKGLFYFFFAIAIVYVPIAASLFFSEPSRAGEILLGLMSVFAFYFGLALLFRRAAR